jgi:threonine dehydratase
MADSRLSEYVQSPPLERQTSYWLSSILSAPVYQVAERTPLVPAPRLSAKLGHDIALKREDLQPVFSFKLRGAYTKLARMSVEARARGVIAVSAGNHAQGVALAAQRLSVRACIVMPQTTPAIKVESVRQFGVEVILKGDTYDQAAAHGRALVQETGMVMVHPYDDADVIAGQGTVASELLMQVGRAPDVVFVPVGGGGLAAGMSVYLKSIAPSTRIIAVEPDDAACLAAAMRHGAPIDLDQVGLFVDGCAVRRIGSLPFELLKDRIDEVISVSTDQVCSAIRDIYSDTRSIVEPAGALAVAGMKMWLRAQAAPLHAVAVLSGANMNFDRLRHIAERTEAGEDSEALFGVSIPEQQGSFLAFAKALGARVVTEFNYRRADAKTAQVFVGIALKGGRAERHALKRDLEEQGFVVHDYSDDETAKLHVRHLVGGHASAPLRERLLRFEFPERPGALLEFLKKLGARWDITLFHYRNHGAAFGRVLAAFQVPEYADPQFEVDVRSLEFPSVEVTQSQALKQFLL